MRYDILLINNTILNGLTEPTDIMFEINPFQRTRIFSIVFYRSNSKLNPRKNPELHLIKCKQQFNIESDKWTVKIPIQSTGYFFVLRIRAIITFKPITNPKWIYVVLFFWTSDSTSSFALRNRIVRGVHDKLACRYVTPYLLVFSITNGIGCLHATCIFGM